MSVSGLVRRVYANNDIQKQLNDIVETIVQLQVYFNFLNHTVIPVIPYCKVFVTKCFCWLNISTQRNFK